MSAPRRHAGQSPFRLDADLGNVLDSPHLTPERAASVRALSGRLAEQGVRAGDPVGICLRRGDALVVAMLAVWSAGASYVPLDPTYPQERLSAMLEDSGASVVVSDEHTRSLLVALDPAPERIDVTEISSKDAEAPVTTHHAPTAETSADLAGAPAYTIFTSGSTGRPKGVCVPRSAVARFLNEMADLLPIGPADTWLAVTTLSFDISVPELLLPLLTGCRSIVADEATIADPHALAQALSGTGTTVFQAAPAMWRILLLSGGIPDPVRLRLSAAEALPPDLAAELLADGCEVWNQYGPTEATVYVAATRVRPADAPGAAPRIVLGPPLGGNRWYVLDEQMNPVGPGRIGQLWLAGSGVALGYLRDPARTARTFLADLVVPGARMYQTGDLARWVDPDAGTLEVLGRIDHQIKVRGFRIEPEEIEVALRRLSGIRDAVVVARPGPAGSEQHLVAFLAADAVDPAVIRAALEQRLPAHLIPTAFHALPTLPHNANGKVDRRALPTLTSDRESPAPAEPGPTTPAGGSANDAAGDPIGAQLTRIWAEVLDLGSRGPVEADDNFFILGGHSLTAARLLARVREEFGVSIRQRELFANPTLAGQISLLKQRADAP